MNERRHVVISSGILVAVSTVVGWWLVMTSTRDIATRFLSKLGASLPEVTQYVVDFTADPISVASLVWLAPLAVWGVGTRVAHEFTSYLFMLAATPVAILLTLAAMAAVVVPLVSFV